MKFRTTLILALIFVIGVAGAMLLNKQDKKKDEEKKIEEKLLNVDKNKISEIYLEPSGIHVVKDSSEWKIVAPIETEGEKSSIDAIANLFNWAKTERVVSSDPNDYPQFGLKPPRGTMIIVHDGASDTLFIGDKSPTGSFVFARKAGSPDVFLTTTSLQSNVEKKLFDLRNKRVLGFEKKDVKSLDLKNRNGFFSLEKDGSAWKLLKPIKLNADASEVNKIVNRLLSARVKEFVDENPKKMGKYGLVKPTATVELFLGENRAKKTLLIGKKHDGKYYARDDSRKPVFLVDSSFVNVMIPNIKKLRNKKLADFIPSAVDSLQIEFSDTTIACKKDTANQWLIKQPIQRKAKNWKITPIASAVANLKAEEFVSDAPKSLARYGLAKPQVKARLYSKGKLLSEILVGKKHGDKQVYLKTGDSKSVYLVKDSILKELKLNLKEISEEPKKVQKKTDVSSDK